MKKSLIALALVGAFAAPAIAEEAAGPHSFSANVALTSDYIFRGISQSQHKPAIQGGFDYSHASGFYAGTWASNVSWVSRPDYSAKDSNSMEWDFYAGYKGALSEDISYDVGAIHYYYPGDKNGNPAPDSTEVYLGLGWKFLSLKYSHSVSSYLFGWSDFAATGKKNTGSGYLDLTASFDLGEGWGMVAHVGRQTIKNNKQASYTDWKLGVTKDVGFGVVGLAYTDTNAKSCGNAAPAYCWDGKDVAKGRAVLSFSKSF